MRHPNRGKRILQAVFSAVVLLSGGQASAVTVILAAPASPSSAVSEALVRIRGELASEGFEVEVAERSAAGGLGSSLGSLKPHGAADAIVTMSGGPVADAVEVRIFDPLTAEPVARRISFPSTSEVSAKTLAIHTLELIRASLLELDLVPASRQGLPRPQPELPTLATEAPARFVERVSVELGATAIFDFDAGAPTLLPLVRVSWALRPWLLPHLTVAGLGTRRTVTSEGASAEVSQQFALLGASYRFRAGERLRPFVSLAGGVLHTSAEGRAEAPDWGREAEQWSFLFDGAAGAWLALGDRLQLALALQGQLAQPYPAFRFSGSVVGTSTRPSLLLTMTLGAWL